MKRPVLRMVVVGGGPSAYPWLRPLKDSGIPWIGIGPAGYFGADIGFSMDLGFLREAAQNALWLALDRRIFLYSPDASEPSFQGIEYIRGQKTWSEDPDKGLYWGESSGDGALNLACLLSDKVYLLGYDYQPSGKDPDAAYPRWYQGQDMPNSTLALYLESIRKIAPFAQKTAKVYNLNPDSALRDFKFESPRRLFEHV